MGGARRRAVRYFATLADLEQATGFAIPEETHVRATKWWLAADLLVCAGAL